MWVCANVKCLCVGWDKAWVQRHSEWMCGFRLWLSRQNLCHWNLFLGPQLFTTFCEGFTRPRGERSPRLCSSLMKVVCGLRRKLLTSPTFILSKPLWRRSSGLRRSTAALKGRLLNVIGVMFDSLKVSLRLCCVHWSFSTIQPRAVSDLPAWTLKFLILFIYFYKSNYCVSLMTTSSCLQLQFPAVQTFQVLVLKYPKDWCFIWFFSNLTYRSDNRPIQLVGLKEESQVQLTSFCSLPQIHRPWTTWQVRRSFSEQRVSCALHLASCLHTNRQNNSQS